MATVRIYLPNYTNSWALVIGIDEYDHVSPLLHAGNDASPIAKQLIDEFEFPKSNVNVLLNKAATRDKIIKAFLNYVDDATVSDDDRILVFLPAMGTRLWAGGAKLDISCRWTASLMTLRRLYDGMI